MVKLSDVKHKTEINIPIPLLKCITSLSNNLQKLTVLISGDMTFVVIFIKQRRFVWIYMSHWKTGVLILYINGIYSAVKDQTLERIPWISTDVQMSEWVLDCCLTPTQQLFQLDVENKLIFNEMMVRSALY